MNSIERALGFIDDRRCQYTAPSEDDRRWYGIICNCQQPTVRITESTSITRVTLYVRRVVVPKRKLDVYLFAGQCQTCGTQYWSVSGMDWKSLEFDLEQHGFQLPAPDAIIAPYPSWEHKSFCESIMRGEYLPMFYDFLCDKGEVEHAEEFRATKRFLTWPHMQSRVPVFYMGTDHLINVFKSIRLRKSNQHWQCMYRELRLRGALIGTTCYSTRTRNFATVTGFVDPYSFTVGWPNGDQVWRASDIDWERKPRELTEYQSTDFEPLFEEQHEA